MSNKIEAALSGIRGDLKEGLAEAEQELAKLDRRREELLSLIGQARTVLGVEAERSPATNESQRPNTDLTLHEAMRVVLLEHPSGLTAPEIANEINARGLYRMRSGKLVHPQQIHARVGNYHEMFVRTNGLIALRIETRP